MALIKEPYGLVYNTDGTLCTTYRDDDIPFAGVRSFAVEEATTNLSPQTVSGVRGISLVYKGEENGWKKYGISGTWNSGTYPYCAAISLVSFTGGEYYSTSAFFKTNCQEKFATYFSSITYTNEPMISGGTTIRRIASDGSIYLAKNGFAYVDSTMQLGYIVLRPKQDGETFDPDQHFLYVKNIQTENKPFATSYVDGSRPAGKLKFNITKTENMIFSGWVKMYDLGTTQWARIISFEDDNDNDNERITFGYDRSVEKFFVSIKDENSVIRIDSIDIYSYNIWYFFAFILDNGIYKAYIYDDNGFCETITNTKSATALSFFDVIVGYRKKTSQDLLNGVIANLYVGKYRKPDGTVIWTDDYIREVYEAQIPFPVQSQLSIY